MEEEPQKAPFKILGEKLKTIRQKLHESLGEVSGAVEIDEQALRQFEQGHSRPSEDILSLLINHFGISDDDADSLWQLAGYDRPQDREEGDNQSQQTRTMLMIMAIDPRVIYSDGAHVTANSAGVIINFSQNAGTPQQMLIARVGMSREQAQALIKTLQITLENSKPRQLPPRPEASKSDNDSK